MAIVGSLLIKLGLDSKGFTGGLNQSVKQLGKIGSDFKAIGSKMTAGITVPMGIVGGLALKTAIDFESGFAGVRKTVNATEEEFAGLRKELVQLSQDIPASAESIFQVAEAAGQLGVKRENIAAFTKTMVDLGNTTNISAEEGAASLARLANVTGLSQAKFSNLGSSLVDLGNNLATTEAEILEMSLRLAGAGTTAGLSVADINGLAGALTSVGIGAEAGGSAFSKVMINMAAAVAEGEDDLKAFADVAGQSAEQFAQSFGQDPARAIQAFIEGLGAIKASGGDLFGTLDELGVKEVRLRDALLRTANAEGLVGKALDLSRAAFKENTALVKEAAQRYKTTASQMTLFQSKITAVGAQIGEVLLPALVQLLDSATPLIAWVSDVVTAFGELEPGIQGVVVAFTVAFAAAGPVLVVLGTFMAALAVITTPMLIGGAIVIGIIAGIAAIVAYWDELAAIPGFLAGVWGEMKSIMVEKFQSSVVAPVKAGVQNVLDAWEAIKGIPMIVKAMVQDVKMWMVDKMRALVVAPVEALIGKVGGFFKQLGIDVVGGSYVPDMVNGIAVEFGRLDGVMVKPALDATAKVASAFEGLQVGVQGGAALSGAGSESLGGQMVADMQSSVSTMGTIFQGFKFSTQTVLTDIRDSAVQVWGAIQAQFVTSLSNMIVNGATFAEFMKQVFETILQSGLNLIFSLATQWALAEVQKQSATVGTTQAQVAADALKLKSSEVVAVAQLATNAALMKAFTLSAAASVAGTVAVAKASLGILGVVLTGIVGFMLAVASAVVAVPFIGQALAALVVAGAATAAASGGAAILAATVAVVAAGATATAALAATIPALADGGIVTGPTLALIGEGGESEVVLPLSKLEQFSGGGKEQTIIVEMDSRRLAERIVPQIPRLVRMKLGAAL